MKPAKALSMALFTIILTGSCAAASGNDAEPGKQNLTPRQIMENVNRVNMGDNVYQEIIMTLTDRNGREQTKEATMYRKRFYDEALQEVRTIMFFTAPDRVAGTGFLTWDYDNPEKEDKQWIFLPTSKKTKRIAGNDKRLSFMGTDFSHADMALRNTHNYNYEFAGEESLEGHKTWIIKGTPVNETALTEDGYSQSILYVRQDNFMVVRSVNILHKGNRVKKMDILELEKKDGYWVQKKVVMATYKAETLLSKTVMDTTEIKFDRKLKDELFTIRSLEEGL